MPLVVIFDPYDPQHISDATPVELGPYRVAQIVGDTLTVDDGSCAVRLAARNPDGTWVVDGLDGLTFASVRFMPSSKPPRTSSGSVGVGDKGDWDPGANDE